MKWLTGQAAVDHVINQLGPLVKRTEGTRAWIKCPYHAAKHDHTANMTVNIAVSSDFIGWCGCFACGTSKSWNDFAREQGLLPMTRVEDDDYYSSYTPPKHVIDEDVDYKYPSNLQSLAGFSWEREEDDDRLITITHKTLKQFHCKLVEGVPHKTSLGWQELPQRLWLPVYDFDHTVVGHALLRIHAEDKHLKCINSSGRWVRSAICGIEQIKTTDYVVIVEGAADMMRLTQRGINAVAMLGSQNISESKCSYLRDRFDQVYLLGDKDRAGNDMNARGLSYIPTAITLKYSAGCGKDPASMTSPQIDSLRSQIKEYVCH